MNDTLRQFRDFFVSLKLTVVLLVLGMVLVFAATIDQVNLGIWAVQEKYFRSFFVLAKVGDVPIPVFPGGYLIGGLLLINLITAHLYRFRRGWKKLGIELTHAGLILLLLGELFSGLWQEDYSMRLTQGEPKNYSESQFDFELAVIDTTNPELDEVVAIPAELLAKGKTIQHPRLPFRIEPKQYYPNSTLAMRPAAKEGAPPPANEPPSPATAGIGPRLIATPLPMTYKMDERNLPTAFVELIGSEGSLGTYLAAPHPSREPPHDPAIAPQRFEYAGRTWTIGLRPTRAYKPFTLTLLKFSHDRYAGTEIPKNFSSRIKLTTPDGRDNREVLIYMNNPLRYAGLTFYQASFEPGNDRVTILQVVRNPSWLVPYIACAMMTLGLVWQFCIHLFAFVGRRRGTAQPAAKTTSKSKRPQVVKTS
jgi:hypothetical protein